MQEDKTKMHARKKEILFLENSLNAFGILGVRKATAKHIAFSCHDYLVTYSWLFAFLSLFIYSSCMAPT